MEFSGLEKLSLVDYDDKLCCVLFTSGCNFRCPFCQNGDLVLNGISTASIPFNEILDYLKKRRNLLDAVTISGGEPTLMNDLKEKIIEIKKLGYLVKLDTNGTNPTLLKDLVNSHLIDYVAMDIKNSLLGYSKTIGVTLKYEKEIKESIEFLISNKIKYEFRTTLVNEFHDLESILAMGQLIKGADKLFLQHFVSSDRCIKKDLHEVNLSTAKEFINILKPYVKTVNLRGYED